MHFCLSLSNGMASCVSLMYTLLAAVAVLGVSGNPASPFRPRVIGGVEVFNRCRSPHNSIVALQFTSTNGPVTFCSAVMLTESYLVTSGFCIAQIKTLADIPLVAVIGERDMLGTDVGEQRIAIANFTSHRLYNDVTLDYNIGLIRLAKPAVLSNCVQPALKMETDASACIDVDKSCIMMGWGPYAEITVPTNSRLLRSANVTVLGSFVTDIMSVSKRGTKAPVGTLFAEGLNLGNKACFFDWGGLVSCQRNGKYVLQGIIGDHNCNSQQWTPILVSNMEFFQTWIDLCLANWSACPNL
ncbi:unnamed protein product [Lymnaea stagnalis]|uniref:Peptidase S1 domain-containing protein n=1 Tax=Lymnaea stagnalis TaxID=6523 RepID=A0AAV2HXC0_LYMST